MSVAMTREERANQRNAVLAGFLGWTFDAFDFFVLTLVIDDVARSFGTTRPQIALALTATLAMRPATSSRGSSAIRAVSDRSRAC